MKKAVIFDLDGTLVNSLPDISAAMNRSLEKAGLPSHEENAYKYKVGNGVVKLAERAVGDRIDCLEAVLDAYREDYAQNCRVHSYVYKGIEETLRGLRELGLRICVLTNKDDADAQSVISYYFPDIPFDVIRGRVPEVPLKPDPAGALQIAQALGLSPEECWYVGDTSMDMNCGNSAGMETVGVLWGFRPREELAAGGAHQIITEPKELLSLVSVS